MAGVAKIAVKKAKKHGKKKFIRPSQKKSAKNGKQLFQQTAKKVVKPKKSDVLIEPEYDENDEFLETDEELTEYDEAGMLEYDVEVEQ